MSADLSPSEISPPPLSPDQERRSTLYWSVHNQICRLLCICCDALVDNPLGRPVPRPPRYLLPDPTQCRYADDDLERFLALTRVQQDAEFARLRRDAEFALRIARVLADCGLLVEEPRRAE